MLNPICRQNVVSISSPAINCKRCVSALAALLLQQHRPDKLRKSWQDCIKPCCSSCASNMTTHEVRVEGLHWLAAGSSSYSFQAAVHGRWDQQELAEQHALTCAGKAHHDEVVGKAKCNEWQACCQCNCHKHPCIGLLLCPSLLRCICACCSSPFCLQVGQHLPPATECPAHLRHAHELLK